MSQALYVVSLKHVSNDNAPMTNAQHIEYLWAILLDTYTKRIEAV